MKKPNHSTVGLLRLLLFGSVAASFALTLVLGWFTYRADFKDSQREAIWTSGVAREHAARVFDTQELVIERVFDLLRGLDDANIRSSESRLHDGLKAILTDLSKFLSIVVTDRRGHILLSSSTYPAPPDVDLSDRDYFQALLVAPDARIVSKAQQSRIDGRTFFGLSRSRLDANGEFGGVISIAISPTLFSNFYGTLAQQEGEGQGGRVVTMIRDDGQILVRYPPVSTVLPIMPALHPFYQSIAQNPEHGVYVGRLVLETANLNRLYAYDKVEGYPLYIVVGRSMRSILSDWLRQMLWYLAAIVPITIMLVFAALVTLSRTRREKQALAQAGEEIARRELAEAALHRAQQLEAVGQLTGGIAHDFNNLLTIIVGNVDMMVRRAEDPERVRRLGGNVLLAAKRVADVTDKLLAFARRRVVRPEVVNVNQLLEELHPLLSQAVSRSITIALEPAAECCPVRIDPGQFESALINLVVNARDAMPDGGTLRIVTCPLKVGHGGLRDALDLPAGSYVSIAVRDTGAGMDALTMTKAFEPFFTTKEIGKGTGLGLSQVYGFAKQAGGHVKIESAVGIGTCVEILLPRSDEEPVKDRQRNGLIAPKRSVRMETILVVEDEPSLRAMAMESLRDLGYRTLEAADAAQALAHLASETVLDLMFSDIVMPGGMDGLALMREARRLRPGLAVILTSGYVDTSDGSMIPADVPLLRKPYGPEDLAAEVERRLARASTVPD